MLYVLYLVYIIQVSGDPEFLSFFPLFRGIGFNRQGMQITAGDQFIYRGVDHLLFFNRHHTFEDITNDDSFEMAAITRNGNLTVG